jgi:segregation and condensation protein B
MSDEPSTAPEIAPEAAPEIPDEALRLAEALVFASADPVGARALSQLLPDTLEIPRRLPRVAMETLAIIAYHQPVTRPEIEEIRGTSLSQQTLDALLEANLVAPRGRKETPGRPTLWGTTPQFLAQFGLKDLRELPRREDLLLEPPSTVSDAAASEAAVSDAAVGEAVGGGQEADAASGEPATGH